MCNKVASASNSPSIYRSLKWTLTYQRLSHQQHFLPTDCSLWLTYCLPALLDQLFILPRCVKRVRRRTALARWVRKGKESSEPRFFSVPITRDSLFFQTITLTFRSVVCFCWCSPASVYHQLCIHSLNIIIIIISGAPPGDGSLIINCLSITFSWLLLEKPTTKQDEAESALVMLKSGKSMAASANLISQASPPNHLPFSSLLTSSFHHVSSQLHRVLSISCD